MKKIIFLIIIACSGFATSTWAACPSVIQLVSSEMERTVLKKFQSSHFQFSAKKLIEKHGFCPIELGIRFQEREKECAEDGVCKIRYELTDMYEKPGDSSTWIAAIIAAVGKQDSTAIDMSLSFIVLGIERFGQSITLDSSESEFMLMTMGLAQVPADPMVEEGESHSAGLLRCLQPYNPIMPFQPVSCNFEVLGQQYPMGNYQHTHTVNEMLKRHGGVEQSIDGGLGITAAWFVTCRKSAAPDSVAQCSIFIESRL